jgi:hypothetical protein
MRFIFYSLKKHEIDKHFKTSIIEYYSSFLDNIEGFMGHKVDFQKKI